MSTSSSESGTQDEHAGVAPADLALLGRHLAAENAHDMDATLATLAEDCVFEDTALNITYRGREGARIYYQSWWDSFDIITHSDRRHFTAEGTVISEARYTGIHKGEFLGIPATQRSIDFSFIVIIPFRNGLMAGERFYWDVGSLLNQLGSDTIPATVHTKVVLP